MIALLFAGFFFVSGLSRCRAERCPLRETQVPTDFERNVDPHAYQLIESALQIYSHLQVECDGYLKRWDFMAANQVVSGLHLGVFRPRQLGTYELVGRSHFVLMPRHANNTWVHHDVKHSIEVKRGDCLGIFYDRFQTPAKLLAIRSKMDPHSDLARRFPTYVMALDDSILSVNRTIDVKMATKDFRHPLLAAVISNMSPRSVPVLSGQKAWSITAPKEFMPSIEQALFQKSLAIQAAAQSQDPPPFSRQSQTQSLGKCEKPSKVPVNFMKLPAEKYRFAETSLQVFSSMVVECDGYLTAWHFLSANPIVEGVHLGVFRHRSAQAPHLLTLVGETRVGALKPASSESRGFWVTHMPNSPLAVKAGDLIGMFYDDYQTPSEMAAILCQGDDDFSVGANKPAPTYVLLTDGRSLSANDTIDIGTAARSYRLPALSATIEPLGFIRFNKN